MEEKTIELPLDVIKASPGFAFDIGGSIAKLVYRSKEDFENGEPKDKERAKAGKGIVRQKLIRSEKVEVLLDFIQENCDLTLAEDGNSAVYTTGVGGNFQKTKIEEALNVKVKNLSESDVFVDAAILFLNTRSGEDLFKPVSKKGIKTAMGIVDALRGFEMAKDPTSKFDIFVKDKIDDYDPEADKQRFPCILAMCGSAFGIMKVNEDGSCEFADAMGMGGRFFIGGVSFLTGVTDFTEMSKLIEESDGRTVDHYASELVDSSVKDDVYGSLDGDWRAFPFGKGVAGDRDQVKKGDLIHSLLESVCENLGMFAVRVALAYDAPRVYFCGNFVNTPKAQELITKSMHGRRYLEEPQVNFEFLQDGGLLGAIGAFIKAHELQTHQETTE